MSERVDPDPGLGAPMNDLPTRVIVDQHGHYWRDYGTHLSMCPVSEENAETRVHAVFERPYRRAEAMLAEMTPALTNILAHKASPPEYPGLALVPVADIEALEVAVSLAETTAAGARIDFQPSERVDPDLRDVDWPAGRVGAALRAKVDAILARQPDEPKVGLWGNPNRAERMRTGAEHGDFFMGSGLCKTCREPYPCAASEQPLARQPDEHGEAEVRVGTVERRPGLDLTGYGDPAAVGEEREAEIERIADVLQVHQHSAEVIGYCYKGHGEDTAREATALYDAGLRATPRPR